MTRHLRGRAGSVLAVVLTLLVATAGTATAAKLITGKQIKDGTVAAADLAAPGARPARADGRRRRRRRSRRRRARGRRRRLGARRARRVRRVRRAPPARPARRARPRCSSGPRRRRWGSIRLPRRSSRSRCPSGGPVSARAVAVLQAGGLATTAQCQLSVGPFGGAVSFTTNQTIPAGATATLPVERSYGFSGAGRRHALLRRRDGHEPAARGPHRHEGRAPTPAREDGSAGAEADLLGARAEERLDAGVLRDDAPGALLAQALRGRRTAGWRSCCACAA